MFLAILRYKVSSEDLEPYVESHVRFLEEAYAKNAFIVSGQMMPDKGGVIFSPLTRRGEFEEILRKDPFIIHDLVSYEVIAFDPSRFHPGFTSFIWEPKKEEILLVPYTDKWKSQFKEEAHLLSSILNKTLVTIHHIGSTAIPGIKAKPIVDIIPVVKSIQDVDGLTPEFEALGYEAKGEYGMPGRRFFIKRAEGKRLFNIHIFEQSHSDIERHLHFRDYLIAHPKEALAYSELKERLAKKYPDNIEQYCWGKDEFVRELDKKAALWWGSFSSQDSPSYSGKD